MMGGIDSQVSQRMDQFRGNPQALAQQYQQNQQLIDLLALQKLKSEKEAAARDMAMKLQQNPQTIAQQREAEVGQLTQNEVMQRMQQAAPSMQQNAQQDQARQMIQQGIGGLQTPNMAQGMARGGIVAFSGGGGVDFDAPIPMSGKTRRQYLEEVLAAGGTIQDALQIMKLDASQLPAEYQPRERPQLPAEEESGSIFDGITGRAQGRADVVRDKVASMGDKPPATPMQGPDLSGIGSLFNKNIEATKDRQRIIAGEAPGSALGQALSSQVAARSAPEQQQGQPQTSGAPLRSAANPMPPLRAAGNDPMGVMGDVRSVIAEGAKGPPPPDTKFRDGMEVVPTPEEEARELILKAGRGDMTEYNAGRDAEYERLKEIYGSDRTPPDESRMKRQRLLQMMMAAGGGGTTLGSLARMGIAAPALRQRDEEYLQSFKDEDRENRIKAWEGASNYGELISKRQNAAIPGLATILRQVPQGSPEAQEIARSYQEVFEFMMDEAKSDNPAAERVRALYEEKLDGKATPKRMAEIDIEIASIIREYMNRFPQKSAGA